MKNNLEEKAKFFAQYWGQNVHTDENYSGKDKFRDSFVVDPENTYGWLELTPLSQISDEDAIECIHAHTYVHMFIEVTKRVKDGFYFTSEYSSSKRRRSHGYNLAFGNKMSIEQIDYLRSKGYALPWMGISVEEQIKRGWVKLK